MTTYWMSCKRESFGFLFQLPLNRAPSASSSHFTADFYKPLRAYLGLPKFLPDHPPPIPKRHSDDVLSLSLEKSAPSSGPRNVLRPNATSSSAEISDPVGLGRGSTSSNPDSEPSASTDTSVRQRLKRNPGRND
ncbi:hypothetical protein B0H19DRAFT_1238396 [Mycena capillaripes]|nr:hypothetical protein B0H19DRAFT_1238396 [Mycena capillaripes]